MSKPDYNVLIINYHYPPIISGGTQRVYNFRKYLPLYGVKTAVITTNSYGVMEDDTENRIFRFADRGYDFTHSDASLPMLVFLFRAYRRIQVHMGFITDGKYYWKTEVLKGIEEIINNNDFDAVIASYPSSANLEIGEIIHNKYKIPLIVDYRDGLMFEPFPSRFKSFFLARKRMELLEKRMGNIASLILTVNDEMNDYYSRNYPNTRTVTIPNGFDDEEEIDADPIELPNGINVLYTGGIAKSRMFYDFKTISSAFTSVFSCCERINFIFIGEYEEREQRLFSRFSNVYVYPKMPRSIVVATQRVADAFLLVSGPKGGTSGKLYEYMFAQKPILNIGGDKGISKIINGYDFGVTVEPDDDEAINKFISMLKNNECGFNYPYLERYTRRYQSKLLAEEIRSLLMRSGSEY